MSAVLPRTRSFHRARPMRLWWLATGIALLANLAVVVGLSQVSRLHPLAVEPPLALRSLRQLPPEPPPPVPPAQQPVEPAVVPLQLALPSLDLPSVAQLSELAMPALASLDPQLELPLSLPAFTAAMPSGEAPSTLASGPLTVDTPAEREGSFDLDRFYPRSARLRGITGSTRIRCAIAADGRVSGVEILASEPPGVFDQAAERLARSLHYRPAMLAGRAVASQQETVIAWTLE